MSPLPNFEPRRRFRLSLDTWAVTAASLLVIAIVAGTLPRIPW
jgi:hypothetical protein